MGKIILRYDFVGANDIKAQAQRGDYHNITDLQTTYK